jgi:hypothetical protein
MRCFQLDAELGFEFRRRRRRLRRSSWNPNPPAPRPKAHRPSCRTPCALTVAAAAPFTVTFALTGYQPQTVPVTPRPSVDAREAGQALKFDPDPVYAQLEPVPPAPVKGKKARPKAQKTSTAPPPTQ